MLGQKVSESEDIDYRALPNNWPQKIDIIVDKLSDKYVVVTKPDWTYIATVDPQGNILVSSYQAFKDKDTPSIKISEDGRADIEVKSNGKVLSFGFDLDASLTDPSLTEPAALSYQI